MDKYPICLCIDGSTSVLTLQKTIEQHIDDFFRWIHEDELLREVCECAIVMFSDETKVLYPFSTLDPSQNVKLPMGGASPLHNGLRVSMEAIDAQLRVYDQQSLTYEKPLLVVITDGEATDLDQDVLYELHTRERNNRLTVIPINLDPEHHGHQRDDLSVTYHTRPFSEQSFLELYLFIKDHVTRSYDYDKQLS
jgi:uncharacterized protein YegL